MKTKLKKTYRQRMRDIFARIKSYPLYVRIMNLPLWVRGIFAVLLFLFGIIGLLTPIPAGWVMIALAFVLIFGLKVVRRQLVRLFFFLRLHHVIAWWKSRFRK